MKWLAELELPGMYAVRRDLVVHEIQTFNQQIKVVEKGLNNFSKNHPGVALLKTIPGVGIRTAETMVAYIDDPSRFKDSKKVGAYFGLVPSQDQSSSTNRLGHITKEGPGTARRLLTEAAWQGVRKSPTIRSYFERITQGNKQRNKIAIIAVSHYLSRVMWGMLKSGTGWRESVEPEASQAA
jgi:transposase